jgi:uncharacterized protein (DUF362 family)
MQDKPTRRNLMLIDGVIGGEGNGPLAPQAVHVGSVIFADNIALGDSAAARLMGFDPERIPLIREALKSHEFPLVCEDLATARIVCDGSRISLDSIQPALRRSFLAPDGWRGHLELQA